MGQAIENKLENDDKSEMGFGDMELLFQTRPRISSHNPSHSGKDMWEKISKECLTKKSITNIKLEKN